jgi:hypothetical protein
MTNPKTLMRQLKASSAVSMMQDYDINLDDGYKIERFLREHFPKAGKRFLAECFEEVSYRQGPHENAERGEKKIAKDLKAAFPRVKFRIERSHSLVSVEWNDGPGADAIEAVIKKYKVRIPAVACRIDEVLVMMMRNQECPSCKSLVSCSDPTKPNKVSCYVCGANGGLDELL